MNHCLYVTGASELLSGESSSSLDVPSTRSIVQIQVSKPHLKNGIDCANFCVKNRTSIVWDCSPNGYPRMFFSEWLSQAALLWTAIPDCSSLNGYTRLFFSERQSQTALSERLSQTVLLNGYPRLFSLNGYPRLLFPERLSQIVITDTAAQYSNSYCSGNRFWNPCRFVFSYPKDRAIPDFVHAYTGVTQIIICNVCRWSPLCWK